MCSFPAFRNELIRSQPLSVFFAEPPSFAKPRCGKQFAGLNCAVKRKPGFQSLEAGRGSVSACRNKCKMLEGNMPRKFDVIAIGTGSGASEVPVPYGDATQRKCSSELPKPLTGFIE